jgi:hypothetical protein
MFYQGDLLHDLNLSSLRNLYACTALRLAVGVT